MAQMLLELLSLQWFVLIARMYQLASSGIHLTELSHEGKEEWHDMAWHGMACVVNIYVMRNLEIISKLNFGTLTCRIQRRN